MIVENLCSLPINPDASHDRRDRARCPSRARSCSIITTSPGNAAGLLTPDDVPPHRQLAARDHQRPLAACSSRTAASTRSRCATRSISIRSAANANARAPSSASRRTTRAAPADARDPAEEHPGAIEFAAELAAREPDRERPPLDHRSGRRRLRRRVRAPGRRVGRPRHGRTRRQRPPMRTRPRPHPVPLDVGGIRQPGDRVDRPPPPDRRRQLPRARRAPRLRRATCCRSTTSTRSLAWLHAPDPDVLEAQRGAASGPTARWPDLPATPRARVRSAGMEHVVNRRRPGRRSGGRASPAGSRLAKRVGYGAPAPRRSSRSSSPPITGFPSGVVTRDRRRAHRRVRRAARSHRPRLRAPRRRARGSRGGGPSRGDERAGGEPPAARQ